MALKMATINEWMREEEYAIEKRILFNRYRQELRLRGKEERLAKAKKIRQDDNK